MQFVEGMLCSECKNCFPSASCLLKHFAEHVVKASSSTSQTQTNYSDEKQCSSNKKSVPDLHPIVRTSSKDTQTESVNPLSLCEVTMKEELLKNSCISQNYQSDGKLKKYKCTYCQKEFGWSTDLKRHIMIHTGERPFECDHCSVSFTRKFLLQNHVRKFHSSKFVKTKIPDLKPINSVLTNEKKEVKTILPENEIKRENFSAEYNVFETMRSPICST